jgi:hypothetical protein
LSAAGVGATWAAGVGATWAAACMGADWAALILCWLLTIIIIILITIGDKIRQFVADFSMAWAGCAVWWNCNRALGHFIAF